MNGEDQAGKIERKERKGLYCFLSGPLHKTCLVWIAPASIALRFIRSRKSPTTSRQQSSRKCLECLNGYKKKPYKYFPKSRQILIPLGRKQIMQLSNHDQIFMKLCTLFGYSEIICPYECHDPRSRWNNIYWCSSGLCFKACCRSDRHPQTPFHDWGPRSKHKDMHVDPFIL